MHVNVEALLQLLGLLENERTTMRNHSPHVIGQPTVGKRHGATALDHNDFGALVDSAQPGRSGHSTGDASDDDDGVREGRS